MVVATIGTAGIGEWFDGGLLIFILALSGGLEGDASARTTRDITALMARTPDEAILLRVGAEGGRPDLVVASPCTLAAMMPTLLSVLSNAARHAILCTATIGVSS